MGPFKRASYCPRCGSKAEEGELICPHCHRFFDDGMGGEAERCEGCGQDRPVSDGYCRSCGRPRQGLQEEKGPISDAAERVKVPQILKYVRPLAAIAFMIMFFTIIILPTMNSSPSTPAGKLPSMMGSAYYMGTGPLEYEWTFHSVRFHLNITVTQGSLAEYAGMTEFREAQGLFEAMDNVPRVATPADPLMVQLASTFQGAGADLRLSQEFTINLMLSFVQSLPTVSDSISLGREEYWRYPVETLADRKGDMIDKSLLLASLTKACGYQTVVLLDGRGVEWSQSHTAVGVTCGGATGTYFAHDGQEYLVCEPSLSGYKLGEACPDTDTMFCVHVY